MKPLETLNRLEETSKRVGGSFFQTLTALRDDPGWKDFSELHKININYAGREISIGGSKMTPLNFLMFLNRMAKKQESDDIAKSEKQKQCPDVIETFEDAVSHFLKTGLKFTSAINAANTHHSNLLKDYLKRLSEGKAIALDSIAV
jgi:hypothetical protein